MRTSEEMELSAETRTRDKVDLEKKHRRDLFIQQFEKEAQQRLTEMEAKMESLLTSVDKIFRVELMKMPLSLQNTLISELTSEETDASEVSIALKNDFPVIHTPLKKRVPSKKVSIVKSSGVPSGNALAPKTSAELSNGGKGARTKTRTGSTGTGNLRSACKCTPVRTRSRVARTGDQLTHTKPKLRSVYSAGDLSCSAAGCAPHIAISTSQGQMLCLSEETKDHINQDMLDDVALHQISALMSLMESIKGSPAFLARKAS